MSRTARTVYHVYHRGSHFRPTEGQSQGIFQALPFTSLPEFAPA